MREIKQFICKNLKKNSLERYSTMPGDGLGAGMNNATRKRENRRHYIDMWRRLVEIYRRVHQEHFSNKNLPAGLDEVPPLIILFRRIRFYFINQAELLTFSQPLTHKIRYFGGIAVQIEKFVEKYEKLKQV